MCDVLVAMPDVTRSGHVLFGKNSDRPAGECQVLFWDPGGSHPPESRATCSYVAVPRGERTLATLGLRPYWCWGYETGINEAGVAGGNAAVFTTAGANLEQSEPLGLTGMDLLRLALERGETAQRCVQAAASLLETYGQRGSAVSGKNHAEGSYDNSFLFADAREAWVLETSGRRWAAERVTAGVRTISNELTIREHFDLASRDLAPPRPAGADIRRGTNREAAAAAQSEAAQSGALDFAYAYEDHDRYPRQVSHIRAMRTRQLLGDAAGHITAQSLMHVLRDHYEDTFLGGPSFHRYLPDFLTVCMHDSPAGFTWGDTATSLIVELDGPPTRPIWVSYLPPCSSAYLPLFFGEPLPDALAATGNQGLCVARPAEVGADSFSRDSLWWRLYRVVKETARVPRRYHELREAFDPLERHWLELYSSSRSATGKDLPSLEERTGELLAALESLESRWMVDSADVR